MPPEQRGAGVEVAHRNGLRLLKLVNTLLDFSRIEAGRVQARYEPVDLAAFTAELALQLSLGDRNRPASRCASTAPPLAEPVYVDRDMWEKIVLNLLSNAFKFTFEGEIAVAVRPAADGAHAELTVRDTGTGIPADELPQLFERFHRVEGARGRQHRRQRHRPRAGAGAGEAARRHDRGARANVGQGSAFTVTHAVRTSASAGRPARCRSARQRATTVRAQAYRRGGAGLAGGR